MATVEVNMNTCDKKHRITVKMRDDGDLDVIIESNCKNVQQYAKNLTRITMEDATDFCSSKIVDRDVRMPLSVPCLVPIGVFDAAWLELGMLSKTLCKRIHSNEVVLDLDDES